MCLGVPFKNMTPLRYFEWMHIWYSVLYLSSNSVTEMDSKKLLIIVICLDDLRKKQNKNNTEASGKVGSAMRIIVWMNYCEIKAYVSPSKISVTSHRMNN